MSPEVLAILMNVQKSLERDLNVLSGLMEQKQAEYIKITSLIYHISGDLEAMASENGEKVVINCMPPDVDAEGRLI